MARVPSEVFMDDYVRFCKFQLCHATGRLMKDPIWKKYTKEEIIAEFFAHKFEADKDFRDDFEMVLDIGKGLVDEFSDWADSEMAKEKVKRLGDTDKVSFNPSTDVIGEE